MKSGNCELNQKINASDGCNLFTVKIGRRWSSGHDGGIIFSKLAGKICFHHSLYLCGAIKIYSNKGKTKIQSTPPEPFYSKHHCVQQTRRRIPAKKQVFASRLDFFTLPRTINILRLTSAPKPSLRDVYGKLLSSEGPGEIK